MTDISLDGRDGSELISFRIGEQEFCVDIMAVREIRGWTPATPVPHSPPFVRGVINLRGAVLPVIDLADRLGLGRAVETARHVIIVVQIGSRIVGLLVDAVCDILSTADHVVQRTPDLAGDQMQNFVRGLIALDGRMISLLDLDLVLDQPQREAA
ncbi:chemotaxis protein CheW [Caulobacter mirabilis]|uniref:Chemotaxis protein CheW n=1 Tax=Caulobacter mirabilis TaxID=69666 RepID=A0A2D2B4B4_9CAUL|nr:chemotaxis protein CheW [Caulobacter mirabilis]ATQ45099.1 chemotaxis protein CheW [Caulobacter mirabilis]